MQPFGPLLDIIVRWYCPAGMTDHNKKEEFEKMKGTKRILSMLLVGAVLAGSMAGCGKKETAAVDDRETGGEVAELEADAGEAPAASESDSDNQLSARLKQKYAGSESSKYEYANPVYNVERDHAFVFEQVGTRYDRDPTYYEDICVYIDSDFINPIVPDMIYNPDEQTLTICPDNYYNQALRYSDDDSDYENDDSVKNWGNAPKYWIVQYNDFASGKSLAKPIVTLFTVKAELDAPTVAFDIDERGYARLSWEPVPGAAGYKVYRMQDSAEFGISMEILDPIGETKATSFTEFPSVREDEEEETDLEEDGFILGKATQNLDFYDFGIKDEESGLSDVYCVVAVNGEKKSNVSNLIYQKDVRSRLVKSLVYNYDNTEEKEEDYETVKKKISELPAYQLVEMADSSIVPMPIDYANAAWQADEFNLASGEGNISIMISAGIQGTDFKIIMYVLDAKQSTIDSDLADLAERQKAISAKSADVKPKNEIDYVPHADNSSAGEEGSGESEQEEPQQEIPDSKEADVSGNIKVTATSALSEYIATYMLSHEEVIDLSMFPEAGDSDYLLNAMMEAYNQNPLIGSLNRFGYDYDDSLLLLEYEYSKDEQQDMQQAVLEEADKVIGEIITDDMNDVEKEFAINDYLCSTAEYDFDALDNAEQNNYEAVDHEFADSFTPYGVLVNKVGVCASYAGAFKVLADRAGLDCYVVTGYLNGNLPHAWNRVAINGQWATVDSTNNDNEKYENALLNIPDYMSSGFLVEDNTYLLSDALAQMEADQEESEFYRMENRYYGYDELESQLETLLMQGETFTIRTDYTITEEELGEILQEAMANAQVSQVSVYMFLGVLTVEM